MATLGGAKTENFILGSATVMLGPQAEVFNLNPTTHSIGLVKNFSITSEPEYVELTQGVKNTLVYSVMNQNVVRATMEAFEVTAKNLAYSLGLDGSSVTEKDITGAVETSITGNATPVTEIVLGTGEGASFSDPTGAPYFVRIERDTDDDHLIQKVTAISTDTLTVAPGFPAGVDVAAGVTVRELNTIDVGSNVEQPFLGAKIVGVLANNEKVALILPKVRITKGFNMAFGTDQYGNLPYEFSIYDLVSTDTFYSDFTNRKALILRK